MWKSIKASLKPSLKTFGWNLLIGAAVGVCVWAGMSALSNALTGEDFSKAGGTMASNPGYAVLFFSLVQGFAAGFTTLYTETRNRLAALKEGIIGPGQTVQQGIASPDMLQTIPPLQMAAQLAANVPLVDTGFSATPSKRPKAYAAEEYIAMQQEGKRTHTEQITERRLLAESQPSTVGMN